MALCHLSSSQISHLHLIVSIFNVINCYMLYIHLWKKRRVFSNGIKQIRVCLFLITMNYYAYKNSGKYVFTFNICIKYI